MAEITGFKELSVQLSAMGQVAGSKAFRSAVMSASGPAVKAITAAAPVGNPPYQRADGGSFDPYPKRTYKGRLVIPGFTQRNIRRRSRSFDGGSRVEVKIGVESEAFYAIQFIEFGTSKFPKRPWMEPAFRSSTSAMSALLKVRIKALIDKAAKT